jgi:uncharacterized protein
MDLKIDVAEVKKSKIVKLSGSYKGNLDFPDDNLEDCMVDVQYKLDNIGNGIYISGILHVNVKMVCSRCLTSCEYKDQITLEEVCEYPVKEEDVFDNYFIEEDILDLKELLRQKINLSLPLKPLCKTDCKGLCFTCGIDLNEDSCNCKTVEPDPVWSKLAEKFNF